MIFFFFFQGRKFGQLDNMPQVELVRDPERYFQLLTCQSMQVKNIQFVNDECVEVYYSHVKGFISGSDKTNVVIAAFTTTHARLKLYSVLECLQTRVLYFDADSVFFTSEPNSSGRMPRKKRSRSCYRYHSASLLQP